MRDHGGDLLLLVAGGLSHGDLVLVRESAEDLFPADPVLGEVDLQRPGVSLSRGELAEGAVRPGGVVGTLYSVSTRRRWCSLTISRQLRAQGAPQQHGIHVDKVDRQNAAGLGCQELLPGRARPARCGVDPSVLQDLPHSRGSDRVAKLGELALHPPVTPRRVVRGHADHELADRGCRGRSSGRPPVSCSPICARQARCQASSVAGVTANTSPHRRRGISRDRADSHSRSPGW
jgi:hypothetical protein